MLIGYAVYNQYNIYPQSPIVHRLNGITKVDRENGNSRIMIFLFVLYLYITIGPQIEKKLQINCHINLPKWH